MEIRIISPAKIVEHQTVDLMKLIEHKGRYKPYKMKW